MPRSLDTLRVSNEDVVSSPILNPDSIAGSPGFIRKMSRSAQDDWSDEGAHIPAEFSFLDAAGPRPLQW